MGSIDKDSFIAGNTDDGILNFCIDHESYSEFLTMKKDNKSSEWNFNRIETLMNNAPYR